MNRIRPFAVAILAALSGAPLAAQQEPDPEAFEAATRYALPHLLSGLRATCADHLPDDGYLALNGDALEVKFAAGSENSWPAAKALLLEMAAEDEGESADLIAAMPDENLRPFVDGILVSLVASEVKPAHCPDIENGLLLIDPLPAENIAGLVGFMFEMLEKWEPDEKNESGNAAGE